MIAPKIKEVFYRRTVFKVPIDDVRYVDGCDVAKLPNEIYVFWNDERKVWQPATPLMIELFTGKKVVQVELEGIVLEALSFVNENEVSYRLPRHIYILKYLLCNCLTSNH